MSRHWFVDIEEDFQPVLRYNVSGKTSPVAVRRALVAWVKEGHRFREGVRLSLRLRRENP